MNRLQFLVGQVGPKDEKQRSLKMILTINDLPGDGWTQLGETSWRSGTGGRFGPISKRARQSKAFVAIRRFRQEEPARGLFVQIGPYASVDDAMVQVRRGRSAGDMTWPGVERLEERDVTDVEVPGVNDPQVWEHFNHNTRTDDRGFQRFILGRVEHIVFLTSGSSVGLGWSWDDLVPIAIDQAARIQDQLAAS